MDEVTKDNITKLLNNSRLRDVDDGLFGRCCCKWTGDITETIGQILIATGGILAFAAPTWDLTVLAYVSGSVSVAGIALIRFSSFAMKESKERTDVINRILGDHGITQLADIAIDSAATSGHI